MKKGFNYLRALRVQHGETQEYVANAVLGIAEATYNRKEQGITSFTLLEARKLSLHYGKPIDALFFDNEVNTNETFEFAPELCPTQQAI